VGTIIGLRVHVHEFDENFAVVLEGDIEQVSSATAGLLDIVPQVFLSTTDGFLCINAQAASYLEAWLHAIGCTHRFAKIMRLPIGANS
jgi:hypothetical protein